MSIFRNILEDAVSTGVNHLFGKAVEKVTAKRVAAKQSEVLEEMKKQQEAALAEAQAATQQALAAAEKAKADAAAYSGFTPPAPDPFTEA